MPFDQNPFESRESFFQFLNVEPPAQSGGMFESRDNFFHALNIRTPEEEERLRLEESQRLRRQRDELDASPAGRLSTALSAQRNYMETRSTGQYLGDEFASDVGKRLPFIGPVIGIAESLGVRNAALRVQEGTASDADYQSIARYMVNAEREGQRSIPGNILDILSYLPGFAAEFIATGGAYSAGRVGATKAIAALGQAGVRQAVGRTTQRAASRSASYLAGAAAQTAAMPHRVAQSAASRAVPTLAPDESGRLQVTDNGSVLENIPIGFLDTMIELGSERAGALLPGLGRVAKKIPGVGPAIESVAERWVGTAPGRTLAAWGRGTQELARRFGVPYHGVAGEVFEERVGEVLRGLLSVSEDYGVVGDILAGRAGSAGRRLLEESVAFSAIPFAYAAASRAMGGGQKGQQEANRVTMAILAEREAAQEAGSDMTQAEASAWIDKNIPAKLRPLAYQVAATFPTEPKRLTSQTQEAEQMAPQGPQPGIDDMAGQESQQGMDASVVAQEAATEASVVPMPTSAAEAEALLRQANESDPDPETRALREKAIAGMEEASQPQPLSTNPKVVELFQRAEAEYATRMEALSQAMQEADVDNVGDLLSTGFDWDTLPQSTITPTTIAKAAGMTNKEIERLYKVALERKTVEAVGEEESASRQAVSQSWIKAVKKLGLTEEGRKDFLERVQAYNQNIDSESREAAGAAQGSDAGVDALANSTAAWEKDEDGTTKARRTQEIISEYEKINDLLKKLAGDYLKEASRAKPNAKRIAAINEQIDAAQRAAEQALAVERGSGEPAGKRGSKKRKAQEGQGDPGVFYHEPGTGVDPSLQPGASTGKFGPAELNAAWEKDFETRKYIVNRIPGSLTAEAAYLVHPDTVLTKNFASMNPFKQLEEQVHGWTIRNGFQANPGLLPDSVAEGFRQFFSEDAPMSKRSMVEGFARWYIRRTAGLLGRDLSPEQIVASAYAESFLREKNFVEKADQHKRMVIDFLGQAPVGFAGGFLSGTGEQVQAPMTTAEKIGTWWSDFKDWFHDNIDTNLGPLYRLRARIAEKNLPTNKVDQAIYTISQTMFKDSSTAEDWSESGAKTILDGKVTQVGPSDKEIIAGAQPRFLADLRQGPGVYDKVVGWFKQTVVTPFDVFLVANHLINEEARGKARIDESREELQRLREQLDNPNLPDDIRDALRHELQARENARKDIIARATVKMNLVPPEQLHFFKRAMAELEKDADFMAWAVPAAKKYSDAHNSHLIALTGVNRLSEEFTRFHILDKPDFVPLTRVREDADWKESILSTTPGRGERMKEVSKIRKGGGEQILAPLQSLRHRRLFMAAQWNEQVRRNAVADLLVFLEENGFGDYAIRQKEVEPPKGELNREQMQDLADVSEEAADLLGRMGGAYSRSELWPSNGKPLWYWYGPNGELMNWRIGNKSLYELITNRQGDTNTFVRMMRGINGLTVLGIRPFAAASSLVRKGATTWHLAYTTIRNTFPTRDPYEFLKNTSDMGSVGQIPGMLGRMWQYEFAVLMGKQPQDMAIHWFMQNHGGDLRMLNVKHEPIPLASGVELWNSIKGKAKQTLRLTSAGELAPRAVEAFNIGKRLGWSQERVAEEERKAQDAVAKGAPYVDPVPVEIMREMLNAAAEVTVPFGRQGIITRELNKVMPFFGPAVAGMSKAMRNWRDNPQGAMIAMSGMLTLKLLHWLYFRDEEWYKELAPYDRFNNIVVPMPGLGLRRLPGPRDLDIPIGGSMIAMLEAASGRNPEIPGLVAESIRATTPPGVSDALESLAQGQPGVATVQAGLVPFGVPFQIGYDVARNEGFAGRPIVPRSSEGLPASERFTQYELPYIARQAFGGRSPTSLQGLGIVPFPEVRNARRSVDMVYDRLATLREQRLSARRTLGRFEQEGEYGILNRAAQEMTRLSQLMRGQTVTERGLRQGPTPTPERVQELQERQIQIARQALEAVRR